MASKKKRENIRLKSSESPHCYTTQKNKTNTTERLALKKYDPTLRRVVEYKETK